MTDKCYFDIIKIKDDKHGKEVLEHCWKIRDFEIELFWKRANYFSLLVGALFIGYYTIKSGNNNNDNKFNELFSIIIAFAGTISSLCWYFSSRGSKHCMEIWEHNIDFLEEKYGCGKLYQTILYQEKNKIFNITSGYHFAVGKIAIFLSFIFFLCGFLIFGIEFVQLLQFITRNNCLCCNIFDCLIYVLFFILILFGIWKYLITDFDNSNGGYILDDNDKRTNIKYYQRKQ